MGVRDVLGGIRNKQLTVFIALRIIIAPFVLEQFRVTAVLALVVQAQQV